MGNRVVTVSDRTGKVLEDKDKATVVVRTHPDITGAKVFDVHRFELSHLRCFSDAVRLEVTLADGRTIQVSCTAEEFEEFFSSDMLQVADSNRGRRTGYSPKAAAQGLKSVS